jgi:thiol-disulfide isomerase/thioredoxin
MRLFLCALVVSAIIACDEPEPAPAESPEGPSETAAPANEDPPAAGDDAPEELTEIDAEGLGEALRAHPGRVLLVNVWSTWCEPCVEEMPELISIGARYRSQGLGLMLISADPPAQRGAALVFLRGQGAPFPSYLKTGSDDRFIRALHPEWTGSLPATLLLDDSREVKHFWERPVDLELLRPAIENALAESAS